MSLGELRQLLNLLLCSENTGPGFVGTDLCSPAGPDSLKIAHLPTSDRQEGPEEKQHWAVMAQDKLKTDKAHYLHFLRQSQGLYAASRATLTELSSPPRALLY